MSLFERWQGLVAEPLQFVRGPSLGACFADELPDAVLQAMHGQPRFRQRLEQLLVRHYQLAPMDQLVTPLATRVLICGISVLMSVPGS